VRSVRVLPDLAISATILLTGLLARELGARRFAVAFSALLVCLAPIYLSGASLLTTNCLEPLLWMGCVYFAILAVKRNPRYWVCFGIVAGIGMEEKYSISVLGFGVVVGLLLTGQRRHLLSRWMWLGGLAALLLFLPNLIWNVENHWPFVELIRNIKADGRDVVLSPWEYFSQQALLILPSSALFWITGVIALLVAQRFRAIQFLGIAYLVAFTVFAALHGKNYYLAPIYPVYLAAGCIMIESGIDRIRPAHRPHPSHRSIYPLHELASHQGPAQRA
jgi:4-amino-4-deoxy-L-arabinose transferase-like glycosyltransferase